MINNSIKLYLESKSDPSSLAIFRIGFGIIMFYSLIRFWAKGWIESIYIKPLLHFKYYGFEWVESLGQFNYILFLICIISTVFVTFGYKYKQSIIIFFLTFTYIELIDKTTYLNHYYFISILSFLMIMIPANAALSIDNKKRGFSYNSVPKWSIDSLKLLIVIVYLYAGIAKINSDWLCHSLPLSIWLTSKYHLFFLGDLFQKDFIHQLMSWGGMIYDISIPFLLINRKTRLFGFSLVVLFHIMTAILFPIGMFPYIMIFSVIIFFDTKTHKSIINRISWMLGKIKRSKNTIQKREYVVWKNQKILLCIISLFFMFQIALPFRHCLYKGELFWTEEGYRFSWRVMLVEKVGSAVFTIKDQDSNQEQEIDNSMFLTKFQEKQMSFQPDFILEYAHFIGDYYKENGYQNPSVYVDCFVSLNGRISQRLIDKNVDLYPIKESFKQKKWILPLKDDIKGL